VQPSPLKLDFSQIPYGIEQVCPELNRVADNILQDLHKTQNSSCTE
jgi:hypothetical protein